MNENKMKPTTGIVLVMCGLVLYNLLKGTKAVITLFIVLMVMSIYEIYKSYKINKKITYDSMMYILGILILIVGILYKGHYGQNFNSLFIPISISVFIIAFIVIALLKGRKVVDRKSMKIVIVTSIISIVLLLLMTVLGIMWS